MKPSEASKPDNIVKLQTFYLKRRAAKAKPLIDKPPYFKLGQHVRRIILGETGGIGRFRGHKPRFSSKVFRITAILDDARPTAFRISEHGKALFYKEELTPSGDDETMNSSVIQKKILGILSSKRFAVKFLRNGKPIQFETRFLVRTNLSEKPQFFTEEEIKEYDNGSQLLTDYQKTIKND